MIHGTQGGPSSRYARRWQKMQFQDHHIWDPQPEFGFRFCLLQLIIVNLTPTPPEGVIELTTPESRVDEKSNRQQEEIVNEVNNNIERK